MADLERRKHAAHKVEQVGTAAALGTGAALGVERVRDRYAADAPAKLTQVAARTGRLRPFVEHARVPPTVVAGGTLLGGAAYAASKYQDATLRREARNARRQAKQAKRTKIAARAPQEAEMETQILAKGYRTERHRRQGEAATAGGGLIAAEAARRSYAAGGKARAVAGEARQTRNVAALGTGLAGMSTGHSLSEGRRVFRQARDAHLAAHQFDFPAYTPPRQRVFTRKPGEDQAAAAARQGRADAAHARRVEAGRAAHKAKFEGLQAEHQAATARAARAAGQRAAALHLAGAGATGVGGSASAARSLAAHGQMRRAGKEAARHSRNLRTRGGVALGLLGTAAALHEAKRRQPPPRIPYAYT